MMVKVKNMVEMNNQKIFPVLWFDYQAEEAMNFYTPIFKKLKVKSITRIGESGPGPEGSVLTTSFELEEQEFTALNGGPMFKFPEAISLFVNCKSQEKVDYYWERLLEGDEEQQSGWIKDKYSVSWQIIPAVLVEMLNDPDPEKSKKVTESMMKMKKIDIPTLKQFYQDN